MSCLCIFKKGFTYGSYWFDRCRCDYLQGSLPLSATDDGHHGEDHTNGQAQIHIQHHH